MSIVMLTGGRKSKHVAFGSPRGAFEGQVMLPHRSRFVDHRNPIPRPRTAWYFLFALAATAISFGLMGFSREHHEGAIVTGMRQPGYGGASWGLYIVFVVYFIGLSFAGITVAALARLFRIAVLEPVTRIAELLTITCLIAGASCVIADLGRPLDGLMKLPRYANPSSPFFGTFTMVVAGYMFASLVFFFLSGRRDAGALSRTEGGPAPVRLFHRLWASGYKDLPAQRARHSRMSLWLSLAILPMLVTAHSTLGFVFGIQGGRPGWFSALQAPGFVMLAGVSGTGALILLTLLYRRVFRLYDRIPDASIRWLGNFLWVLALVYLYFLVVEELTATYAAPIADRHLAHEILGGRFAPFFWATAGSLFLTFLIPFILYLRQRTSLGWVAVAAASSNVAALCKRFIIVVPSQTHGAMMPLERGEYWPSWVELAVVVGLVGLVLLLQLTFGRVFPLVPSHAPEPGPAEKPVQGPTRGVAAGLVALMALGLISFGLLDSFRTWSGAELDPRMPYAPVVFASGVMLLFIAAVVYELFPDPRPRRHWPARPERKVLDDSGRSVHTAPQEGAGPSGSCKQLQRLAQLAEAAVRNGEAQRALVALRELQRLAAAERVTGRETQLE